MSSHTAQTAGSASIRPSPGKSRPSSGQKARWSQSLDWIALGLLIAPAIGLSVWGFAYYTSPPELRVRSEFHQLLKPSGLIGQSLGIIGLLMFLFMWLYPLRKQMRWLARTGSIATWLRVHIVIGLALPVLIAVHASWRFEGLVGLGYLSMVIVCVSGVIGRYIYSRIPHHMNGVDMSREDVINRRRTLITAIAVRLSLTPQEVEQAISAFLPRKPARNAWAKVGRMLTAEVDRWHTLSRLRREWLSPKAGRPRLDRASLDEALQLAGQEIRLAQQSHMLDFSRRIFGYWHVAHRPFAVTALVAVLIHVGVVYFTGATWFG